MDYLSPFTFLFKDKAWLKKFLIASLLTYTLIGADPVTGWLVEIVRRVSRTDPRAVPDWPARGEWKPFWKDGTQFVAVNVFWLLPLVPAALVLYLPVLFIQRLSDVTLLAAWGGTLLCVVIFLLIYSIVYLYFFPTMLVLLARTGRTGQSASPILLWKAARPHFVEYLLVFLIVGLGLVNIALLLSALTFFLLLPPILVYIGLVTAHFAGQLARLN